jgi:hypothetical protein
LEFNSGKALDEKYVISGKEMSRSAFLAQSPYGTTVSLRKIQFGIKELSSHSIESMISLYPSLGGNPEFLNDERIQPDTFDRFKELEISSLPDIRRYYAYEISGVSFVLLFNSLTGGDGRNC